MCSPYSVDIRPRRLPAEIKQIEESSSDHGIRCYIQNDSYESLEAIVPGPKETPYEEIQFKIAMEFDEHYPFRPPSAKFLTPVYHPNIDTDGKICLDVLRMPPGGSYNPAITLESILLSIQLLLASPNNDDPLRYDVSDEYRYNRELFNKNAKKLSGFEKPEVGNNNKRLKTDDDEIPKCDNIQTLASIDEEDETVNNTAEPKPNTSNENETEIETAAELVSVITPQKNRKRKHDET
ncbi:ubiquitin-conjugating enzyme E2 T-like [Contarinia nasturtii]|uniref:ubiquitin-conjugating enzyme E2 T-like n=1 Tax=Contarinia nasturtii TaxID=265458 RepID=UPI0012D3F691|nr:ubiquitin-conjugating enzyme E2 T-like [Contarinia nasturtii]